jgi:hypothetical protein
LNWGYEQQFIVNKPSYRNQLNQVVMMVMVMMMMMMMITLLIKIDLNGFNILHKLHKTCACLSYSKLITRRQE